MNQTPAEANRSFAELLRQFASEITLLVRQELELARAEIRGVVRVASASGAAFGVCAVFAHKMAASPPTQTIQTVKEDVVAVQSGVARGR